MEGEANGRRDRERRIAWYDLPKILIFTRIHDERKYSSLLWADHIRLGEGRERKGHRREGRGCKDGGVESCCFPRPSGVFLVCDWPSWRQRRVGWPDLHSPSCHTNTLSRRNVLQERSTLLTFGVPSRDSSRLVTETLCVSSCVLS